MLLIIQSKNKFSALFVLSLLASSIFSSGCNPPDISQAALVSGKITPASMSLTPTGSAQVGEACTGGSNKICLAIHFVAYQNSKGVPTASTTQASTIIHKMNQLYSQCNIGFQIEKYESVDPTQSGLSYGAQSQNETDEIRRTYEKPTNQLLAVTTGPWGTAVNAWTSMPGEGVYGAIMEASIVGYGNGIIYAHEFGHYLGLDHVSDNSNLMSPVIYTSSTTLTSEQCETARDTVSYYWSKMVRN